MKLIILAVAIMSLAACASRDSSGNLWQAVKITQVNK